MLHRIYLGSSCTSTRDHVRDCVVLNRVLAEIAKRHAQVKFVKIRAKTAVPDWPDEIARPRISTGRAMRKQLRGLAGNGNGAAAVHGFICGAEAC